MPKNKIIYLKFLKFFIAILKIIGRGLNAREIITSVIKFSSKKILDDSLETWEFDYEEKKSLTCNESMIVKISNLRKKNG